MRRQTLEVMKVKKPSTILHLNKEFPNDLRALELPTLHQNTFHVMHIISTPSQQPLVAANNTAFVTKHTCSVAQKLAWCHETGTVGDSEGVDTKAE